MADYPLGDIKVLDLTQYVSGPYCTQVLADLGATVLKVERPGTGDIYRRQGPVFVGEESVSFLALNRGKRSIALDLREAGDRERLQQLAGEADVLVENFKPGSLARYGLDYEALAARCPRLVYCSISGFGQQGPLASQGAFDLTIQAISGLMALNGHPEQPPAKVPVAALDFGSALYGAVGILAALHRRAVSGRGEWVRTSLLETGLAWLSMHITSLLAGGEEPQPLGSRSPFFAPYEAYATADGSLVVVGTGEGWSALCATLGLSELETDPRFAENSDRVAHAEELRELIEAVLVRRTTAEWCELLEEAGVPHAPVQRLTDVLGSGQVQSLGAVTTLEHPEAGEFPIVRLPLSFAAGEATATAPPPALDADAERGFS